MQKTLIVNLTLRGVLCDSSRPELSSAWWLRMDLVSLCQEPGLAAEVVAFLSLRDAGPQGPAWPPRASSLSYHARRCSEYSAGKWRRVR